MSRNLQIISALAALVVLTSVTGFLVVAQLSDDHRIDPRYPAPIVRSRDSDPVAAIEHGQIIGHGTVCSAGQCTSF